MKTASQGEQLRRKIEERIGSALLDLRFYAAGQNANLYLVDLPDGRRMIAKAMQNTDDLFPLSDLEPEGWTLEYLSRKTKLPVPRVHWYDRDTVLMDFVESSGRLDDAAQENAAEHLAALHNISSTFFGFERDTNMGPFPQPNAFETSWQTFFIEHRLLHAAQAALTDGVIDAPLMRDIEKLAVKIDGIVNLNIRPSLVHGDLWGGNILHSPGRIAAFIDPAIYFADAEMDLAAIRLFETFGEPFFRRYNEIRPISQGFEIERRYIYGLYPLLVNARSMGNAYVEQIRPIVSRFI